MLHSRAALSRSPTRPRPTASGFYATRNSSFDLEPKSAVQLLEDSSRAPHLGVLDVSDYVPTSPRPMYPPRAQSPPFGHEFGSKIVTHPPHRRGIFASTSSDGSLPLFRREPNAAFSPTRRLRRYGDSVGSRDSSFSKSMYRFSSQRDHGPSHGRVATPSPYAASECQKDAHLCFCNDSPAFTIGIRLKGRDGSADAVPSPAAYSPRDRGAGPSFTIPVCWAVCVCLFRCS